MKISVYCGNCENGPIVLGCSEDAEKTRCTSCGVYMHDAILEEDFDEDYCHGCESGVDCAQGHSKKCQQEMERKRWQYMTNEHYCNECESETSQPY